MQGLARPGSRSTSRVNSVLPRDVSCQDRRPLAEQMQAEKNLRQKLDTKRRETRRGKVQREKVLRGTIHIQTVATGDCIPKLGILQQPQKVRQLKERVVRGRKLRVYAPLTVCCS